ADIDLAVKDLVRGAFGHAGQKCSATSLALIEKEVYENPKFIQQLKDAAESLTLGGSWNPSAKVTPVIRQPDKYLERGLTQLEEGESWLIEPKMINNNPCHWSPGIRLNVQPGSWYHTTECFGPVLGLIPVDHLEQAIEIQNSSDFGLTGGLHSLDPSEIQVWRERVEVGNAYINRTTTGAIVRRQPFGGWKDSCVGPGSKAGGPNYVATLMDWTETGLPQLSGHPSDEVLSTLSRLSQLIPESKERLVAAARSYGYWWNKEFSIEHDPSQIHGETNDFRYRRRPWHLLRIQDVMSVDFEQLGLMAMACQQVGTHFQISIPENADWLSKFATETGQRWTGFEFVIENQADLIKRLELMKGGTMRIAGEYDEFDFSPSRIGNVPILPTQPLANGRIELLYYLREQSVSETVHRYGNIFE
ncbi:MAG: aldehyde dehydrogenase family protein, partial [Mariniblastus sp.]|nr:aldehyde dehydrogenase family protein [Mariniblastus sp.]